MNQKLKAVGAGLALACALGLAAEPRGAATAQPMPSASPIGTVAPLPTMSPIETSMPLPSPSAAGTMVPSTSPTM